MAPFNPDIPKEQSKAYFGLSKGIEQPKFQAGAVAPTGEAAGAAMKSLGQMFQGGVSAADDVVKSMISEDVRQSAEAQRDKYTEELDVANRAVRSNPQLAANDTPANTPSGEPKESLAATTTAELKDVPRDLKNFPQAVAQLHAARGTGKISETDYDARLTSMVKDIRSKYPMGYYDYIDRQVQQITGKIPANAYIQSVMGDINSFIANANQARNHLGNLLDTMTHEGIPHADVWATSVRNGGDLAEARKFIVEANTFKYKQATAAANLASVKDNQEATSIAAAQLVTDKAGRLVAEQYDAVFKLISPDAIDEKGNIKFKGDELESTTEKLRQHEVASRKTAIALVNSPIKEAGGKTMMQIDSAKANKIVEDVTGFNKWAIENWTNEKSGMVGYMARLIKEMQNRSDVAIYKDPDLGKLLAEVGTFNRTAGTEAAAMFMREATMTKLPEAIQKYRQRQELMLGSSNPNDPVTMKQLFDQGRSFGVTSGNYYNDLLHVVDRLKDPKVGDGYKERVIRAIGDPKNAGFIAGLQKDSVDSQGRPRAGQWTAFDILSSADVTKEAYRLSQAPGQQQLFIDYRNWVEGTFKDLVGESVKDLNGIQDSSRFGVTWDSENHKFNLVDRRGSSVSERASTQPYFDSAQRSIRALNSGLENISRMADVTKQDVNEYLFNTMRILGLNVDSSKIQGLPDKMIQAIISANKPAEKKKPE